MITRTRATPGGHDEYGDPTDSASETIELHGCAVAPRSSSDTKGRGRNGTVEGLTMYCPPDTDITDTDTVTVSGISYRIDGEVGVWGSPFGDQVDGIEVSLKRAKG